MRVASYNQYNSIITNTNSIQVKQSEQQYKMSSGKDILKASDNPNKAKQIEILKQSMSKIDQYQKNTDDAKAMLQTTVTTLQSSYGVLDGANTEILKALNGTYNADDLETMATVIDKSIEQLVSNANTKHLNRYMFSGEAIQTKPYTYDGTTLTYNGNDNDVNISVSPYVETTVISSGNKIYTKMINDLIAIRDQIKVGDKVALQASYEKHQQNMTDTLNYVADVGVRMSGLSTVNETFISELANLEIRRSSLEDVEYTELMVDYSSTKMAYESTLKAASMLFSSSILDYI